MMGDHFWDNQRHAQKLIAQMNQDKEQLEAFAALSARIHSFLDTLDLLRESYDKELHVDLDKEYTQLVQAVETYEISILLNGDYDHHSAILEFHPGAGGTESQDWAEMLYRLYVRWAERKGFKMETLDYQVGEEAGIKSASLLIRGINAFGYLKAEKGVHRLVRISPFDASGRRHTSFASVEIMPQFTDEIDIEVRDTDLKIDTYRSGGAGGQHVNKTDSAVRITHLPTGIVSACQSERSQIQNRERAMAVLKSKLYQRELEQKTSELDKIRGVQKSIEWGSQIRSYVFAPYTLVKDHRTDYEVGDVNSVMNGDIDEFIYAYLKMEVKK